MKQYKAFCKSDNDYAFNICAISRLDAAKKLAKNKLLNLKDFLKIYFIEKKTS